jgi:hypothetical protein
MFALADQFAAVPHQLGLVVSVQKSPMGADATPLAPTISTGIPEKEGTPDPLTV